MLTNRVLSIAYRKLASLGKDDSGFVLLYTMGLFLFLYVICGSVYAVGDAVYQKMRLQNACDEAAYSAAVVEADGLARMAIVNQALAWNYVQMSNKQMDYITAKWLKLIKKRYEEDRANAKLYHWRVISCSSPSIWLWIVAGTLDSIELSQPSDSQDDAVENAEHDRGPINWDECKHGEHDNGAGGWWCGLGNNSADEILLNQRSRIQYSKLESLCNQFNDKKLKQLGESIDNDKVTIESLNAMLEMVARNMQKSMDDTAQFVLTKILNGNALDAYREEQFLVRVTVPLCVNPYQPEVQLQSIFSPAYNTESFERIVLDGISAEYANSNLIAHFGNKGKEANGLDQWFVRGEGVYSDSKKDYAPYAPAQNAHIITSPSYGRLLNSGTVLEKTQRSEGAPGLQRVYKDANLNETGAGILGIRAINRGNHVLSLLDSWGAVKDSSDAGSNNIGKTRFSLGKPFSALNNLGGAAVMNVLIGVLQNMVDSLVQKLVASILDRVNGYMDIMPSAINQPQNNSAMCQNVPSSTGLVAEYRWASAKWICTSDYEWWVYAGWYFPWSPVRAAFRATTTTTVTLYPSAITGMMHAEDHYSIPKWFCGTPAWLGVRCIPPLSGATHGHGYFEHVLDFGKLLKIFESHSRDGYRSCAITPDGRWDTGADAKPAFLRGHARVYGDDYEIWDNRYVGSKIKPWLLNEKYFTGGGSVVVAAARVQRNPFAVLFDKAGATVTTLGRKNFFYPFDPGQSGNYMWAVSTARAGVKRARASEKDQRAYQVVYDDSYDPKNHKFSPSAKILVQSKQSVSNQISATSFKKSSLEGKMLNEQIVSGCNCGTNLTGEWNLCETDWDAVLLPTAYAGASSLYSGNSTPKSIQGKDWSWGAKGKNYLAPTQGEVTTFKAGGGQRFSVDSSTRGRTFQIYDSSATGSFSVQIQNLLNNRIL